MTERGIFYPDVKTRKVKNLSLISFWPTPESNPLWLHWEKDRSWLGRKFPTFFGKFTFQQSSHEAAQITPDRLQLMLLRAASYLLKTGVEQGRLSFLEIQTLTIRHVSMK